MNNLQKKNENFFCPKCSKNDEVKVLDKKIQCNRCKLSFEKNICKKLVEIGHFNNSINQLYKSPEGQEGPLVYSREPIMSTTRNGPVDIVTMNSFIVQKRRFSSKLMNTKEDNFFEKVFFDFEGGVLINREEIEDLIELYCRNTQEIDTPFDIKEFVETTKKYFMPYASENFSIEEKVNKYIDRKNEIPTPIHKLAMFLDLYVTRIYSMSSRSADADISHGTILTIENSLLEKTIKYSENGDLINSIHNYFDFLSQVRSQNLQGAKEFKVLYTSIIDLFTKVIGQVVSYSAFSNIIYDSETKYNDYMNAETETNAFASIFALEYRISTKLNKKKIENILENVRFENKQTLTPEKLNEFIRKAIALIRFFIFEEGYALQDNYGKFKLMWSIAYAIAKQGLVSKLTSIFSYSIWNGYKVTTSLRQHGHLIELNTLEKFDRILDNLDDSKYKSIANDLSSIFKKQPSHYDIQSLTQPLVINERKIYLLNNFESLKQYIQQRGIVGGLPNDIDIRNIPGVSMFNKKLTNVNEQKKNLIKSLINGKVVNLINSYSEVKMSLLNLIEYSNNYHYLPSEIKESHNSPNHASLLNKLLAMNDHIVAINVPLFHKYVRGYLSGFIDVLLVIDGIIYVCDYKPDLEPFPDAEASNSFINSIPQVAGYGLLIGDMFKSEIIKNKIKSVIFNKNGIWIFDPATALKRVTNLMHKFAPNKVLLWEKYFNL